MIRLGIIGGMVLMAVGALACSSSTSDPTCHSQLTSITSSAPGTITLHGSFYSDESLIVRPLHASQQIASGTPATAIGAFTFTGIPSGQAVYEVIASCSSGQQSIGSASVTVQ